MNVWGQPPSLCVSLDLVNFLHNHPLIKIVHVFQVADNQLTQSSTTFIQNRKFAQITEIFIWRVKQCRIDGQRDMKTGDFSFAG